MIGELSLVEKLEREVNASKNVEGFDGLMIKSADRSLSSCKTAECIKIRFREKF